MRHLEISANIELEKERTNDRIEAGELPWNCSNPTIPDLAKLALIVEEIGEVAECIKFIEGMKPRLDWTPKQARAYLQKELIQILSIIYSWLETPLPGEDTGQ